MRVLVLGGVGAVCNETTRDLAQYSDFDEIVVADYNLEAANALVEDIDDKRLKAEFIDANDYDAMLKLIPGYDVVVNGLPWKYDVPVTKACVAVGVDGLDVSTEEEQWDFHATAKDKDMIFIPGVGATPGITNVMARNAAAQMDQVDDVQINFTAFRSPAPAPGLLITFLYEFHPVTEERAFFKDGEFVWVEPFKGAKLVDFGGQIGEQEAYYVPHTETYTIPKALEVESVSVRGCFPPHAIRLARMLLEAGLFSEEPISVQGIETTAFEMIHDVLLELPETKETPLWAYGLVVEVFGKKNGKDIKITHRNQHPPMEEWGGKAAYYKNIAIPLSIGAQMIARGDIKARGVLPPEKVIDPGIFFRELDRRGIKVSQKVEAV
jgi:saccharopine dehydrogenase-like NADP-dependent oxidoreductase